MQESVEEVMNIFMNQYYLGENRDNDIPGEIYVNHNPSDSALLENVLGNRLGRTIRIKTGARGEKARLIRMALENARVALKQRMSQNLRYQERLDALRDFLKRDEPVNRIECFDISHLSGDDTVGACVVFGSGGAIKSDYRRYNIENITRGDDYEAMAQVIDRHYVHIKKDEGKLPDLILLDGGKGQVSKIKVLLRELQLDESVTLLGIAKGPERKAGLETLILSDGKKEVRLQPDSIMLHLLQEIRDEAHRFAITGNRRKRKKKIQKSPLETIEGVGQKRRQQLILYFGGMQGIMKAGPEELSRVPGISQQLALKIYDRLHG
jgi:excinuclease ABC subunit C